MVNIPARSGFQFAIPHKRLQNGNIIIKLLWRTETIKQIRLCITVELYEILAAFLAFASTAVLTPSNCDDHNKHFFSQNSVKDIFWDEGNFKNWTLLYREASVLHMHWRALKYFWNYQICIRMMFLVKTSYPCKENDSGIAFEANFFFSSFLDVSVAFQNSERDPRTFLNTGFIEQYYIFLII